MSRKQTSRRAVLKKSAITCGLVDSTSTFSRIVKGSDGIGLIETGSEDEIKNLLKEGKIDEAHNIADEYGVNYNSSQSIIGNDNSGDVGTNDFLENPETGNSTMSLGVYESGEGAHRYTFLLLDLAYGFDDDSPGPKDGVAISFSESMYRPIEESEGSSDRCSVMT
ncbi:hypothetical protein [Haloarchaeobius iranensis]|uniref:hypothetical protein n=1 Tax=Haloarchaeobius iranensis TaxID=996166 RepID=UPI00111443D0|nr:hypothetical protein [Haloarchaeobius iranensis]